MRSPRTTSRSHVHDGTPELARDLAIDLGTANTLVYARGEGIVLNEPSVIALNSRTNEVLAMGRDAWKMIGRTPSYIVAVRPLRKGAITDFEVTQEMIRLLLKRVGVNRFNRPRVVICVPSAITAVEKRAVTEAARKAGATEAQLIEQPMAAAIGAGLSINEPMANMVVVNGPIRDEIESFKPHVVYTLLEEFHYATAYDQHIASYLELIKVPYTGCNPRGLILARGKDLSKTLVHHRRIAVPAFAVFPINRKVKRPSRLALPLIVKSLSEDASLGIAQKSIVDTDEKLAERVTFIHEKIGTAAIAEQYIDGRELYVGVLGNDRMRVLPIWELEFGDAASKIATAKVKFDVKYQEERGILQGAATNLPPDIYKRIQALTRRICRTLELDGYARIDFRLSADGVPYFIEANPNPEIARHEVFAEAAAYDGMKYSEMLRRIIALGIQRARTKAR